MVNLKGIKRLYRPIFAVWGGILLLLASVAFLPAALQNWGFTTAANYTYDSDKIDVSGGVAKLKPVTIIHNEEDEFSGTHSSTQWATDHIELSSTGLSSGSGTYTSQTTDSGSAGTQWGKISWTEVLAQNSASFSSTKSVGSVSTGSAVFGTDIDGDDDIDLVVLQGKSPLVHYFENDGAEAFTSRTIDAGKPKNPADLYGADFNGDGLRDVVVIGKSELDWFENKGGTPPKWKRRAITPKPSTGLEVEAADVNGDGAIDVVIGDDSNVKWYENNGANPPDWTARAVDSTLSLVDALSSGDLDGDGDLDLLAGDDSGIYWYESNGANPPVFTKRNIDTTIVNAESVIAADLNNDGKVDVVGVGLNGLNLSWYENNGSSPPGFTKRTVDSGPLSSPVSVVAGDIDRDGNVDLALVDGADVLWYRNGGGAQPTWTKATLTSGAVSGGDHLFLVNLLDDVNGDDDLDLVVAENNQVSWWENLLPHSNIRFQLRTSADGSTWSSWQGPGGRTTSSYTKPTGETITVPNGRYIQYRAFIKTHNGNSLNAELSMVRLDLANQAYPTDNPTVQNKAGLNFTSVSSFTETLGGGNQGVVKYQISKDGTVWYYHSGSVWVPAAQGFTHANTAAEVNSNIASFDDNVGAGTFFFKAFLNSDGSQQVELDQIQIDYSTVGTPTQLVFSVQPTTAEAKKAISPAIKVQVQDANGKLVTTATDSITLAIGTNPGGSSLGGTSTVAAVGGEATFSNVSVEKVGTGYTLTASSGSLTSATSSAFNITAGAASKLVYSVQPSSAEVKAVISPEIKVQVQDANGNLVTTATTSVTLAMGSNPGGAKLSGTLTLAAVGGEATFNSISIDKTGSGYTLIASGSGLTSVTSSSVNVTAATTNKLVFSVQPTTAEVKKAISPAIKVQVQDANGKIVTTATDSITLSIGSSSGGTKLAGTTTVAAVGGEATFSNISADTAGSGYTLVASASGLTSATSAAVNITAAADVQVASTAKKLVFSVQPTSAVAKASISPAIKVQVQDANGKLVTTATNPITLSIGSSSGGAKLAGTSAVGAVGGIATFSNISIDTAGSGFTLVASASGLTSATSAAVNITAAANDQIASIVKTSDQTSTTETSDQTSDAEASNQTSTTETSDQTSDAEVKVADAADTSGEQQLDSGASDIIPVSQSAPITEKVTEPAEQETTETQAAETSKQETGTTSTDKTSTPQKVAAKTSDTSKTTPKTVLEDSSSVVPQVPPKQAVVNDEPATALINRETEVESGETVTIRFRAESGLAPEIDLYDANNVRQVTAAVMTEVGNTGVYEYKLTLDAEWGSGDFTVIASDSNKGSLNRMTLAVASVSDTSVVQGQTDNGASVIQENTGTDASVFESQTDSNTKVVEINADTGATHPVVFTDVQTKLNTIHSFLSKAVEEANVTVAGPQGVEIEPIQSRIREISELLKQVSSENGVNLDVMYGSIDKSTGDVVELRDKVERLKVLLELNREISEKDLQGSKKPMMKTWFESGSVILRILVVNPSKEEPLTVPLNVYLPKEVTPDDIIDLGDLTLDFDFERELYSVHNEVTLEPGQSITKLVRMEDIWLFDDEQLSSVLNEANLLARRLEETPYAEDAVVLFETVVKKIQEIIYKQKETTNSPGEHIKAYRQGIITIATIEQELTKLNGRVEQEISQELSQGELPAESLLAEGSVQDSGEEVESAESLAGLKPE